MTTSQIDTAWPLWATTAPDEIRRLLLPEQWGPWGGTFRCINSNFHATEGAMVSHYAEPPHFSTARRTWQPSERAGARPSRGLPGTRDCASRAASPRSARSLSPCSSASPASKPSALTPPSARLMTNGYCQSCDPRNPDKLPLCRGRVCRENGQQRRIQRAGCCNISGTSRRRHCAECCTAAAANLSAQVMPSSTSAAGAAARRKSGDERRERIRDLRREGLDNRAIADRLGVHVRTVQRALEDASGVATDQT